MKNARTSIVAMVMLILVVSGAAWAGGAGQYSGFLDDYPKFEPDKDRKGAMIYRKAEADLKPYTKILIDPIEIWVAPDSKYKGIKPDEMKSLADALRQALVDALEPEYPVVSKPGPGVLGVRLAITNVHLTKKKRGLLGYTPVGLVVTTGMAMAGMNINLHSATIEAEVLDAQSNERLGALIDRQPDVEAKAKAKISWEGIESTLKFYATRFRARLDAERGR
jgi:hypothetical protein